MNLLDSRRGQMFNSYLVVIIFLFAFGFMSITGYLMWDNIVAGFTDAGYYTGVVESTGDMFSSGFQSLDYIIVVVLIVLIVGIVISSYRLKTSAIYLVVTIFFIPVLGFISYFFNYIFSQIVSEAVYAGVIAYFPRTILICTNLHWVMLVTIVLGSISLYAKRQDEEVIGI